MPRNIAMAINHTATVTVHSDEPLRLFGVDNPVAFNRYGLGSVLDFGAIASALD